MSQLETIPFLVNKTDTFELVRDNIAGIIFCNSEQQQILAAADGEDPELWKLQVYTEASDPFEKWLNLDSGEQNQDPDLSPIVNVWFESSTFPEAKGNIVKKQHATGIYNIDIYGLGFSQDNQSGGHVSGDKLAALECQRAVRLVRNFLMAAENAYLQLRGLIGQRWIQNISSFQPRLGEVPVQNILGMRIAFRVEFIETSPQVVGEDLEEIGIELKKDDSGQITTVAELEYIYP